MNTSTLLINALFAATLACTGASGQFTQEDGQDLDAFTRELALAESQIESELNAPTYELVRCSCYGPGLYGKRTASGLRLSGATTGVAHKNWPFGTELSLSVGEASCPASVIDRGPYANHAQLDLTEATVRSLGYSSCRTFGVRMVRIRKFDLSDEEFTAAAIHRFNEADSSLVSIRNNTEFASKLN